MTEPTRTRSNPPPRNRDGPKYEIVVTAPRCKKCGSKQLKVYKTPQRDVEGITVRHSRCRLCDTKHSVVEM